MKNEINPQQLHIVQFASAGAHWSGEERLAQFDRLMEEVQGVGGESRVNFEIHGEMRVNARGTEEPWLHLEARANLILTCQRCLGPVEVSVSLDRHFRFVASETQAEQEDDASEEDVLVLSKSFDVLSLIEDELLMEQPLSPKHGTCPSAVRFSAVDTDFVEDAVQAAHPFAALGKLQKRGVD
jgi:uncharacterized protein